MQGCAGKLCADRAKEQKQHEDQKALVQLQIWCLEQSRVEPRIAQLQAQQQALDSIKAPRHTHIQYVLQGSAGKLATERAKEQKRHADQTAELHAQIHSFDRFERDHDKHFALP